MYDALRKGYLGNFPRLTPQMFNADRPNSTSTAKGHLRQSRQKTRHKAKKTSSPPPPTYTDDEAADELQYSDYIFAKIQRTSELLNSSDMAGRFTHISYRGYEYMLVSVFRGYIHVEILKNRQGGEIVSAYRATYDFYTSLGHTPKFQMLDNEYSNELTKFFLKEAKVEAQYAPPSTHRRNRAERAIQDWKGHFIACLDNVDLDFKMSLWCELVPQVELTINHLRHYSPQPSISAYEGLFGKKYDFWRILFIHLEPRS